MKKLRQIIEEEIRRVLKESTEAKKLFYNILSAAKRQGKFNEVIQMLDVDYGVWFTDEYISDKELLDLINRADYSALDSRDLKDIVQDCKTIIKL